MVTAVNRHTRAPLRLLVNINERHMLCKRPYLFSYLLSEPGNCGPASINITLPHPQGSALFLLDVNDVYTCACGGRPPLWTVAIAHDGAGPQAGDATGRPNQPASVGGRLGHGSEEPGCLQRFITGHKSLFSPTPLPPPRNSILQAECRLNQSWHAECPWVDWHSFCRCVCVCVCVGCCCSLQAVRDAFCIISSRVKGYSNKCLNAIAKFLDWARDAASSAMTVR